MKTQHIALATLFALSAGAALAAGPALAQTTPAGELDGLTPAPFVSTRTRAEVQAETIVAMRQHQLLAGEADQPVATTQGVGRSRAAVKAEVLAARADGTLISAGEALTSEHPLLRAQGNRALASLQH